MLYRIKIPAHKLRVYSTQRVFLNCPRKVAHLNPEHIYEAIEGPAFGIDMAGNSVPVRERNSYLGLFLDEIEELKFIEDFDVL